MVGIAVAVALCVVATACAAPEPTVVVYLSGVPEMADWILDEFRSAHPEEVVRVEQLGGSAVLERLRAESAGANAGGASRPQGSGMADVWLGAPTWHMAEAAADYARYGQATKLYLRAHKADPEGLEPVWGLAEVAYARGRIAEARRWFNKYLELDPGNEFAQKSLEKLH